MLDGYRGHVDALEPGLAGWVVESARPQAPVRLLALIDGTQRLPILADQPRPDVSLAGEGGPNCGFFHPLPASVLDGAEHDVLLMLPDGRPLRLPGYPPRVVLGTPEAAITTFTSADLDRAIDLLRRTFFEGGFDPDQISPQVAARWIATTTEANADLLVAARVGERLVGYARLERSRVDRRDGVVRLSVLAAYRRKGLGTRLMSALLGTARTAGFRELWLTVAPDNIPALRLYDKLGFGRRRALPAASWSQPGELIMSLLCPGQVGGGSADGGVRGAEN